METVEAFFYGLYMDPDLLNSLGFNPSQPVVACVESYALDLRGPAKIIPSQGSTVWGTLMTLPASDLDAMYAFDTTKHYKPEKVTVKTVEGSVVSACCYNLPVNSSGTINKDYLEKLIPTAHKLGLPGDYIKTLEAMNYLQ